MRIERYTLSEGGVLIDAYYNILAGITIAVYVAVSAIVPAIVSITASQGTIKARIAITL